MSGLQLKTIVASDAPIQLTTDGQLGFNGLAGITNEDPSVDVLILRLPSATPSSIDEIYRAGSLLPAGYDMQYQFQDQGTGNVPANYWFAALPFGPGLGDTIAKRAYVATPMNDACTFVASNFVLPALNNTVQITVLDTSAFAVGDYVDRATNAGVFVGGRFWDIVSIDSGTTMTIRLRDVFGAVVIMLG
jgi:hypothetical protein